MSNSVEIYICLEGQALKDGKVEYSQNIQDKYQAENDAKERVRRNPMIHKIAYYKINDEGDFRIFYSFTNTGLHKPQSVIQEHDKKPKKKKPPKPTFWQKLFGITPKPKPKTMLKKKTAKRK